MKIKYQNKTEYRNKQAQLHRTDGPAVIHSNGWQEYWQNGKKHRTNGPAVIESNGYQEYYLNGKYLTKEQYEYQISK